MPISREIAREFMVRLRRLPWSGDPADSKGARQEIGEALMEHAEDAAHAKRIVDCLMDRLHQFPVRADVIEAAEGTRAAGEDTFDPVRKYGPKPVIRCPKCTDSGVFFAEGLAHSCWCAEGANPMALEIVRRWNAKNTTVREAVAKMTGRVQ